MQHADNDAPASDAAASAAPVLDPHRLEVYAVALDFHSHIAGLAAQRGQAHLRDQLTRASLSIVLNTAEAMCPHCLPMSDGHAKRGSCAR